jgi:hypothetical protein
VGIPNLDLALSDPASAMILVLQNHTSCRPKTTILVRRHHDSGVRIPHIWRSETTILVIQNHDSRARGDRESSVRTRAFIVIRYLGFRTL